MIKSLQRALTERAPTDSFQRAAAGVRRQREVGCLWLPSRPFELRLGRHADAALEAEGFFEPEWRFVRNPEWYRGWLMPFVSRACPWTAVFLIFGNTFPTNLQKSPGRLGYLPHIRADLNDPMQYPGEHLIRSGKAVTTPPATKAETPAKANTNPHQAENYTEISAINSPPRTTNVAV